MKKLFFTGMLSLLTLGAFCQNPLGLDPASMMQYVGKINRTEFEKIVGERHNTALKEGFTYITYDVSDKDVTESTTMVKIYCLYLGDNDLLVNLYYRKYHPDNMEVRFKEIPSFIEGNYSYKTALFGHKKEEVVVVEKKYWIDKFVMTINRYEPRGAPYGLVNYYIEP